MEQLSKKFRTFTHILVQSSFPQKKYYLKIPKVRFLYSLKYIFSLFLLINFILLGALFVKFWTLGSIKNIKSALMQTLDEFPRDLVITIKNGQLMTTYDRPYIFYFEINGVPHPLIAIDEYASADKINNFQSLALLTRHGFTLKSDNDNVHFYKYHQTRPVTVGKHEVEKLKSFVGRIFAILPFVSFIFVVALVPFFTIVTLFGRLLYLAVISLFVFFIFRLKSNKIVYKKVLQISIHATTIPIILETLLLAFGISIGIPLWFLLLNIIFIVAGVYEAYFDTHR